MTRVEAEVLTRLARIEGELVVIRKLVDRVNRIENCLFWLKGGWAVLIAALFYVLRQAIGGHQ